MGIDIIPVTYYIYATYIIVLLQVTEKEACRQAHPLREYPYSSTGGEYETYWKDSLSICSYCHNSYTCNGSKKNPLENGHDLVKHPYSASITCT